MNFVMLYNSWVVTECFLFSGPPTIVEIDIMVRSMGPISEGKFEHKFFPRSTAALESWNLDL